MRLTTMMGVPLDSSGTKNGLELAPTELRAAGLPGRLNVRDLGDLGVYLTDPTRDAETGWIAFAQVVAASKRISAEVEVLPRGGERPLLVGGDCTLLIGVAAALRAVHGRAGLAFVDGHLDCYDGASSPSGEGADMELATLLGRGPRALTHLAGTAPLLEASVALRHHINLRLV